ncbi:hypothetical protein [Capsulimonas corticalis]|uniref:hypothetical protein n=1 Tax=Capsulimonas corticalis TaxID=2219043 RepID=UPI000F650B58|nr:hypothetical protein [Capsulimonas corticalis]
MYKKSARLLSIATPLVSLFVGSSLLAMERTASAYTITDLGITQGADIQPSGASFKAITINDRGNIATWTDNAGQYQGYLTATGTWLYPRTGNLFSVPLTLDNSASSNVVGLSRINNSSSIEYQAVEWIAGSSTPTVLNISNFVGAPDTSAYPFGINTLGEIAGESYGVSGGMGLTPGRGFIYSGGTTIFLPAPANGNGSRACAINSYGQLVGAYYTEGPFSTNPLHPEAQQGVVWTPSVTGGTSLSYILLGSGLAMGRNHPAPGDPTCAYAINRDGLTVGYGFTMHHAFLWCPTTVNGSTSGATPETLYDLGVLTTTTGEWSDAYSISSPTLVGGVGTATIVGKDSNSTAKAVKWTVTYTVNPTTHAITLGTITGPTDLNTTGTYTGWVLQSATSVNSSNAIVGYGTYTSAGTTNTKAFRLQ